MKTICIAFLSVGLLLAISGCSTASYSPPSNFEVEPFTANVDADYDTVWTALIDHASQRFFSIENFEKDSRLLTLSFGSSSPSRFVDCGRWSISGAQSYDGTYVDYISQLGATLNGNMNITVRRLSDEITIVRVNTRYVLNHSGVNMPGTIYASSYNNTWAFDTGTSATIQVSPAAAGTTPSRTCKPTYVAERSIISAVIALSS